MSINEEDIYFKKQEMAARQRIRDEMARAGERAGDGQRQGLADRLRELGFVGEKAKLFDLMPLIHVAWADGSVSRKERSTILDVVRARGVQPGTDAFQMIESMLEEAPDASFMSETLAVLKEVTGGKRVESIVELCLAVANASGGFLGLGGKIADEERERIREIASHFGAAALSKVQSALS
ncbi:MAG: TerB family tellurite resistance protein [Nannocystis sp.]|nr:TerB family tellurite resistance protein [Nannocystis sp.]